MAKKKLKVWSDTVALKKLKEWCLKRDKGRCVFCRRNGVILDLSHFWGRYKSATRYYPDNVDIVCRGCHFRIENAKQGEYRLFKIKQLGESRYEMLQTLYYQSRKTRRECILDLMRLLGKIK